MGSIYAWLWLRLLDRLLDDFLRGTFPPAARASDRPIAIACLRLVTRLPERPLLSVPCFRSCIARSTFFCAFSPYLAIGSLLRRCLAEELQTGGHKSAAVRQRRPRRPGYNFSARGETRPMTRAVPGRLGGVPRHEA